MTSPPVARSFSRSRLPAGHRRGLDPDPERMLYGGDPQVQIVLVQPLDLGFLVDHLGAAGDHHAPPGPGVLVVVIGFKADQILTFGRGELRPGGRAENRVLPVHDMADRQDGHLAIREKAEPSHWDRAQQPQALAKGQYLKPGVIRRIPCHFRLLRNWPAYPRSGQPLRPGSDSAAISCAASATRPRVSKRSTATSSRSCMA